MLGHSDDVTVSAEVILLMSLCACQCVSVLRTVMDSVSRLLSAHPRLTSKGKSLIINDPQRSIHWLVA